jgi:ABC-type glycerol-3-phosphate transport system substrate-binding protein
VDTLAVYFNKPHYEDRIPNRGRPASLWKDFIADATSLTKPGGDASGFEVSGAALGRTDNITRGLDIFSTLVLQYGGVLYNQQGTAGAFKTLTVKQDDRQIYPFTEALNFFTSFARSDSDHYTWNASSATMQDPAELLAFSRGQVSSIFGYSDTYQRLTGLVGGTARQGIKTLSIKDIGIVPLPQLQDPSISTSKRDALASYHFETVSRNSKYQKQAWELLLLLGNKKNQEFYYQKTHKPTSRRDLLDVQSKDPIYGVFAQQVGFASSLPIYDGTRAREILSNMIQSVVDSSVSPKDAVDAAEAQMNVLLPKNGFIGPGPHLQPPVKK